MEEAGVSMDLSELRTWLEKAMFGDSMSYTPKGLIIDADWGSLRIAALYSHIAFRAAFLFDSRADDTGEVVNVRPWPASCSVLCCLVWCYLVWAWLVLSCLGLCPHGNLQS